MRARIGVLVGCMALATLAACDKAPPGKAEVAAKVYGDKITVPELDAELKAAGVPDITDQNVRRDALQRIILRKLLAKAAHDQKLDRDPSYPALKQAAVETFEAQLVQKAAVDKATTPTIQDATAFVAQHPEMFAQRTIYLIEELVVPQRPDPGLVEALKPVNDFDQIEKILSDRRVPYSKGGDQIDTLRVDPNLSVQIARLPQGAAFVLPAPTGFAIARVRASKVEPVTGEQATTIASSILTNQRKQKALNDAMEAARTAAKANISYGEGYAPPAPPATPPAK